MTDRPHAGTSIPPSLTLVGRVSHDRYLQAAHDVEVQDGFAYVVGKGGHAYEHQDGTGGSFGIVTLAPPSSPTVVGGLDTLRNAQTVRPAGEVCFVADDDGVHTIDILDPTSPSIETTAALPAPARINGMTRWGPYLFALSKNGPVHVLDASRPRALELVGSFDTGLSSPHDIAYVRGHLAVPNYVSGDGDYLSFFRVAEAGQLRSPDDWTETAALSEPVLERANRLVVRDPYVFVTANVDDAVVAVAFVDPNAPSVVDALTDVGHSVGIALANDYLFHAVSCSPPFEDCQPSINAIDVADPAAMTIADRTPRLDADVDFHDGEVYGGFLYLSGQATNELLAYDVGGVRLPGVGTGSVRTSSVHAERATALRDVRTPQRAGDEPE